MYRKAITIARNTGTRFRDDCCGNVAVTFALILVPITLAIGSAVDYSRANGIKAGLQAALDAAVLVGLKDITSNQASTAQNIFYGNFVPKIPNVTASVTFNAGNNGTYSGSATASVPTTILSVMHVNAITVTTTSTATVAANVGNARCIISLNLTAQAAVSDSGSSVVNAPRCTVQVNSNDSKKAVDISGSAQINSAENCIVGTVNTSGGAKMTPSPDAVCKAMADPFAGMALPSMGACDYTDYKPANNETLQPGVYCHGLSISSVSVAFAPGLYIIKEWHTEI